MENNKVADIAVTNTRWGFEFANPLTTQELRALDELVAEARDAAKALSYKAGEHEKWEAEAQRRESWSYWSVVKGYVAAKAGADRVRPVIEYMER